MRQFAHWRLTAYPCHLCLVDAILAGHTDGVEMGLGLHYSFVEMEIVQEEEL
jgi:hypothetical protein